MNKREERFIIATNLKRFLKENKLTAKEVAKDLNISYSTFGDWTRERTAPNASQLKAVADYFKVAIGDLTTLSNDSTRKVSDSEVLDSKVRIHINRISETNGEKSYGASLWEYIPRYLIGADDAIGFILNDDSMEPEYHKGDIIIARRIKYLNSTGDYILESCDGDEWLPSYQFARVINKGSHVLITPLNNDNEKEIVPVRMNEIEYLKKYKSLYSIIRLIRDYEKYR